MFPCTLFVLMRTNSPSLCVRYSCGCGRIALVCVYAIRADAEEWPVFACRLLVLMRTNSPCLGVRYSCGCGGIARVCVYAIGAVANESFTVAYLNVNVQ